MELATYVGEKVISYIIIQVDIPTTINMGKITKSNDKIDFFFILLLL